MKTLIYLILITPVYMFIIAGMLGYELAHQQIGSCAVYFMITTLIFVATQIKWYR